MHRAHDYDDLVRRWKAVAQQARLKLVPFARTPDFEHFYLRTRVLAPGTGLYISAGIHGDEAGSTEGLITWAERMAAEFPRLPLLIFPCLNPWGLVRNVRCNAEGLDLNRMFDREDVPVTVAVRKILGDHQFALSLCLHEDYDAQGIYLYEVKRERPYWGESVLKAAQHIIPVDPRKKIDLGRPVRGVIRRTYSARRQKLLGGMPEAIYLDQNHSRRAITFETPSEFALEQRADAHGAVINECIRLIRSLP